MQVLFFHMKRFISPKTVAIIPILLVAVFGVVDIVRAGSIVDSVAGGLATPVYLILQTILNGVTQMLGALLLLIIGGFLQLAQYNDFINATAVSKGWAILRDFANMFFIIMMLTIAVSTILGRDSYSIRNKKYLGTFIGVALAVNFSKTICGVVIDASQVVMLTFMGAISQVGAGNFAAFLGLPGVFSFTGAGSAITEVQTLAGYLVALMFLIVALVVMGLMFAMLIGRVVALWFLVVLSPIVFVLSLVPMGKTYFDQWLRTLINQAITGPVMAFFLWLSFSIIPHKDDAREIFISEELGNIHGPAEEVRSRQAGGLVDVGPTRAGTLELRTCNRHASWRAYGFKPTWRHGGKVCRQSR